MAGIFLSLILGERKFEPYGAQDVSLGQGRFFWAIYRPCIFTVGHRFKVTPSILPTTATSFGMDSIFEPDGKEPAYWNQLKKNEPSCCQTGIRGRLFWLFSSTGTALFYATVKLSPFLPKISPATIVLAESTWMNALFTGWRASTCGSKILGIGIENYFARYRNIRESVKSTIGCGRQAFRVDSPVRC